jgi:predicted RNA-binding protein YlxR (DUF448 family)
MGRRKGHIPIRTCISCGVKRSKEDLVRLVLDPQRGVRVDMRGNAPGRGAYVCARRSCWERLASGHRLAGAFRRRDPLGYGVQDAGIENRLSDDNG